MDNPDHSLSNIAFRFSPRRNKAPGFPSTYEVHPYDANTEPSTIPASQQGVAFNWPMTFEGRTFDTPQLIQNAGPTDFFYGHGSDHDQNNSYATTSGHSNSSNPAPIGEGTFGTNHQTTTVPFPLSVGSAMMSLQSSYPAPIGEGTFGTNHQTTTISFPLSVDSAMLPLQPSQVSTFSELAQVFGNPDLHTQLPDHTLFGYFFSRPEGKPKAYHGLGLVPQTEHYKPSGYLYQDDLGIWPYFTRSDKDLQNNHALVGYLQRKGTALDRKKNRVWFHYVELEELEVSHPKTAKLMSVLQNQARLSRIEVKLRWNQDMGSDVFMPMIILEYQPGDPVVLEQGATIPYRSFREMMPAEPEDPIRENLRIPCQDGELDSNDEDLNENAANEIFLPGTRCIRRARLQKHAPKFKKLLDRTILFFHTKLLRGEYFYEVVYKRNLSASRKQLENTVCCHSAWAETLAYSETAEYETVYIVQNSLRTSVRIIVEDHFPHILENQERAAEAYYKFVREQAILLLDEVGSRSFLDIFSYGVDLYEATRAATTLCNSEGLPFHHPNFLNCLRTLLYGPVPPTLTNWPPRAQSVGVIFFHEEITEDVISVCAAHWLWIGLRRINTFDINDIRELVRIMRFRLSVTPRTYIDSLQFIINHHAAV